MMKRLSMFITALLCCAGSMMAQAPKGTFSITPKVGLNISTLTDDAPMEVIVIEAPIYNPAPGEILPGASDDFMSSIKGTWLTGPSSRFGYAAGVEMEYQFEKKWAIALEAQYGLQGAKYDDVDYVGWNLRDVNVSMQCLNIPLSLKYYVLPGFAVRAGIQLTLCSSKFNYDLNIETDRRVETNAGKIDYFKNHYFSLPVGLIYESGSLVFDARYNIGLNHLHVSRSLPSTHCNTFAFTVGYKFPL